MLFDGNDWVNLNSILMPESDNFTLEVVFSFNEYTSNEVVLGQTVSTSTAKRFALHYSGEFDRIELFNYNGQTMQIYSDYKPALEEKVTATIVKNGNMQIWINGEKAGEETEAGMKIYQGNTVLGRYGMSDDYYFNGIIYSLKAYDEVLPQEEIVKNHTLNVERFKNDSSGYEQYSGYVRNGLQSWYDGHENLVALPHSYSTKKWEDLMGTNKVAAELNGGDWRYNGLHFDGDDYVDMNAILMPESDNFTLEFVVSINHKTTSGVIVGQNNSSATAKNRLALRYNGSKSQLYLFDNNGSTSTYTNSEYTPKIKEKVNVTIMKNNNIQIWVNAAKTGEQSKTGVNIYQLDTVLGRWGWYDDGYFEGTIYSVRKYNRALTAQEMQTNYNVDKMRFDM